MLQSRLPMVSCILLSSLPPCLLFSPFIIPPFLYSLFPSSRPSSLLFFPLIPSSSPPPLSPCTLYVSSSPHPSPPHLLSFFFLTSSSLFSSSLLPFFVIPSYTPPHPTSPFLSSSFPPPAVLSLASCLLILFRPFSPLCRITTASPSPAPRRLCLAETRVWPTTPTQVKPSPTSSADILFLPSLDLG